MVSRYTAVPDAEPIEELIPIVLLVKFIFPANVTALERAAIIECN